MGNQMNLRQRETKAVQTGKHADATAYLLTAGIAAGRLTPERFWMLTERFAHRVAYCTSDVPADRRAGTQAEAERIAYEEVRGMLTDQPVKESSNGQA